VDLGDRYKKEFDKKSQQNYLTGWSFMTPNEEKKD